MPISNVRIDLIKAMSKATNILFTEIVRRTSTPSYPDEIPAATRTLPPKASNARIVGTVEIDLTKAPMALAFEFGSGLRATQGPKTKYRIPDEGSSTRFVAFPKERWPGYRPHPDAPDVFVFPFVMHPGIKAKPYIEPSIEAKADEITELLGDTWIVSLSKQLGPDVEVIR